MEKNEKLLDPKVVARIGEYLSSRIGWQLDMVEKGHSKDKQAVYLESQEIKSTLSNCGLFRHIIDMFQVEVTVWRLAKEGKEPDEYIGRPSFQYNHPDGGSNGHELSFRLQGSLSGSYLRERD
jgi:hypothetical protein